MKPCKTVHPAISMRLNMLKHAAGRNRPAPYTAGRHRTHCWQAPCTQRTGTVLAASSQRAAPYVHRAAKYRAQPVRRYAALSAACTALHIACPLRVRRPAHRATPCIKIKIVLFFLITAWTFPVSVRCCPQCARRVRSACTVDIVHAPCTKRRKLKFKSS